MSDADEPKPLISYPTEYPFKVIGRQADGFADFISDLFAAQLGAELPPQAITTNQSGQGTYLALTVTVLLQSEGQRQAIYAALHRERQRILYYL